MPPRKRIIKLLCIVVIAGIALWVGLHGALRARELGRRMVCGKQLMGIATAMKVYVHNGWDGKTPFIDWLLVDNPDSRRWVNCPGSGQATSNYVIVPLPQSDRPFDNLKFIAYEPKSNHGGEGGNVVFADGHVKFVPVPEYDQLIHSTATAEP